ncbi:bifunctional folylpolyglutamate synthase/dihydrofolate synthase [Propionibacterium australiense]|uniref:tetrahydrofolate synthase n=1 Tax=Propionibacterium australiense TaxID=119981 RepID=A0A8B3FM30_9ACTN|nr:folylpolyglutamate synthase/dihydrofolate synthase family protein [Propionibacterium australiense]RLP11007.1 bifunctional folylpolyglutamate synthase/dihydrofolate synthase [Propionibacterium australiense]RLP13027.1 bifunctional folylpolyglutamate synthase/dihydrofolate synthase [Propionibacterium australiense]VEH90995.1 Folylpolyglutamate synthase [Propionibacterium australiense]
MTSTPEKNPGPPSGHARIVESLTSRWPEHRIGPTLARIEALCELLGSPQDACPVIAVTGTNGKGSTAAIIDALLRSMGLRTGRFSSPHLQDITERICIDGSPIEAARFDELWEQISPMVGMVDAERIDGIALTFFEAMVAMAYAAFADAPVDVAIMEVGMGGRWDATNVADAQVGVVGPVDLDHMQYLGGTIGEIAAEKAGIIKPGATAVLAGQLPEAAAALSRHCAQVGATMVREGPDFALLDRQPAVGGQLLRLEGTGGPVGDLFLPLHGAHMAHNAAVAVAAVEAFCGGRAVEPAVLAEGLANVRAPGRLEAIHHDPLVVLDTAHNPHGVRATLAGLREAFAMQPVVGVLAMMADKQVDAVLDLLAAELDQVVVTAVRGSPRAMGVADLAQAAVGSFGRARVHTAQDTAEALNKAMTLARGAGEEAGVLVIGSVHLAGEARDILADDTTGEGAVPLTMSVADDPDGIR